jgi:hypothetical protein
MALAEFQHCPACERPRGDVGISQRCPDCTCPPEDDLLIIRQSRPSVHALTLAGVVLFVLAVPGVPVGRWPALALLAMGRIADRDPDAHRAAQPAGGAVGGGVLPD